VDSLTLDVECGYARRRQHGNLLAGGFSKVIEERRFTGARFPGDECVAIRRLHDIEGLAEVGVDLNGCFGHFAILQYSRNVGL
jgi:hypothetical protein